MQPTRAQNVQLKAVAFEPTIRTTYHHHKLKRYISRTISLATTNRSTCTSQSSCFRTLNLATTQSSKRTSQGFCSRANHPCNHQQLLKTYIFKPGVRTIILTSRKSSKRTSQSFCFRTNILATTKCSKRTSQSFFCFQTHQSCNHRKLKTHITFLQPTKAHKVHIKASAFEPKVPSTAESLKTHISKLLLLSNQPVSQPPRPENVHLKAVAFE